MSGHPLFHGLIAASVCKSHESESQPACIVLFFPLTIQSDTEFCSSASAFHTAIEKSQICVSSNFSEIGSDVNERF